MDFTEVLKREYIRQCSGVCNHGGYTRLEAERERIRKRIMEKYRINDEGFKQIMICEETVFSYLEELKRQKFRHYMWITEFHESKLIDQLSTALQSA